MVARTRTHTLASAIALTIALGTLSACGSAAPASDVPPGDYSDLTLAESKSPAQLLRNEAVSRIPSEVVLNVGTDTDGSIACLSEDEDPKGYIRQWQSSVDVNLRLPETPNAQAIVDSVVASFNGEGWMSQAITGSTATNPATLLTNGTAEAEAVSDVQVRIEQITSGDQTTAYIRIDALGPCVVTGGADSQEVKELGRL